MRTTIFWNFLPLINHFSVLKCSGSLFFLCQPFGSILSGCFQGVLGRKKSMLIVNVPFLVGQYLLYYAESVTTLYYASIILGFSMGCLAAPTMAYIGEITEARLRGMMTTFTNSNTTVGLLLGFTLANYLHWKMVMGISCLIPVITTAYIFMVSVQDFNRKAYNCNIFQIILHNQSGISL